MLAVNGEIYNHRLLEEGLVRPYAFQTTSDCEVILALYAEQGVDFLNDHHQGRVLLPLDLRVPFPAGFGRGLRADPSGRAVEGVHEDPF